MFDSRIRPLIDPTLAAAARRLAQAGVTADQLSLAGLAAGLAACAAVLAHGWAAAFALVALNRLIDGLDGAVARQTTPTDRGGFIDIVFDFLFYGLFPLAFAFADPAANALAAALLLASFYANGTAFLAFAAIAARRKLPTTTAQGRKSITYLAGLAEGTETVAVFLALCLFPSSFGPIATVFALVCFVSAAARIIDVVCTLGPNTES